MASVSYEVWVNLNHLNPPRCTLMYSGENRSKALALRKMAQDCGVGVRVYRAWDARRQYVLYSGA